MPLCVAIQCSAGDAAVIQCCIHVGLRRVLQRMSLLVAPYGPTSSCMQGYDFVHLCREEGVQVQVGGSDQWGNITAGWPQLVRCIMHAFRCIWKLLAA
jgi:hypothetical protein